MRVFPRNLFVFKGLRLIYTASAEAEAEQQLVTFAGKWDKQYPTISRSWLNHWKRVILFDESF